MVYYLLKFNGEIFKMCKNNTELMNLVNSYNNTDRVFYYHNTVYDTNKDVDNTNVYAGVAVLAEGITDSYLVDSSNG